MNLAKGSFAISSKTFKDGAFLETEQIYNGYGCTGKNISPELSWSNPPDGTKSYALIMHDPDAPVPDGWYHWIIMNIPTSKTTLSKGELLKPPIILTQTSFGKAGYGGPCPPIGHGKHRYIFTIYALNIETLPVDDKLAPNKVEADIKRHALANTSITGYYER